MTSFWPKPEALNWVAVQELEVGPSYGVEDVMSLPYIFVV